jgi:hypothetical protein
MLVVGMHNSGTSVLAEILHRHGLVLGVDAAHHENRFFRNEVNEGLVMGGGDRWARLPILSVEEVLSHEQVVRDHLYRHWLERFRACGYDGVSPWGFKDPRTCVLLPLYLEIFPDAKVLHILRDPDDLAASLSHKRKRGVGIRRDPEHWKRLAAAYTERVRYCAEHYANPCLEISYEELCREPVPVVSRVFEFLGLPFSEVARAFVVDRMHTARIGTSERSALGWKLEAIKTAILGRR